MNMVAKVFENMIAKRLSQEMEEGRVLSEGQCGFRSRRSTTSAIMELKRKVKCQPRNDML